MFQFQLYKCWYVREGSINSYLLFKKTLSIEMIVISTMTSEPLLNINNWPENWQHFRCDIKLKSPTIVGQTWASGYLLSLIAGCNSDPVLILQNLCLLPSLYLEKIQKLHSIFRQENLLLMSLKSSLLSLLSVGVSFDWLFWDLQILVGLDFFLFFLMKVSDSSNKLLRQERMVSFTSRKSWNSFRVCNSSRLILE